MIKRFIFSATAVLGLLAILYAHSAFPSPVESLMESSENQQQRVRQEPMVEFHVVSSEGWSIQGTAQWTMFAATLRGVLRPGEELEFIKLNRVKE